MRNLKVAIVLLTLVLIKFDGCWGDGETEEEVGGLMEKTEREALYSAIQGFVGNSWNGSDLYPDPCGWTPIEGVSCDLMNEFWYVTDLNIGPLHENSLTCTQNPEFRPQIFELRYLKSLSFYKCFTSHNLITLPSKNWEKLAPSLESLEFHSNPSLVGPIPSSFGNLRKLQSLVLIDNGISESLPSYIGNLVHLKRLVFSGNKFSGQIPDTISNLKELLILDLSRNSISGYIPLSIGYLNSLLKLDLSNNMLVGNIPSGIGNLKNLTLMDFRSNNISGGLTRSIEEMESLQELILSDNPIGGDIRNVDWKKLQKLMILDLSNLGLLGEFPKSMIKLKKLRYMGLGNNSLTGYVPSEIANMPGVSAIYVNGNNLTGKLKFSEAFYGKLGRRFGAWNNPNLCYTRLTSPGNAPIGVQPCKPEEVLVKTYLKSEMSNENGNILQHHQQQQQQQQHGAGARVPPMAESKSLNSELISSLGLLCCGFNGFWWVFLVETCVMVVLWNFL